MKINDKVVCHVRWMIRRDMPSVLDIEGQCFDWPWKEDEFISFLRQRDCIGKVVEVDDQVVGFMLYKLHKDRLHLLDFAVHPKLQRSRVGTAMINDLTAKLSAERRNRITLEVRETNLAAQMFFKSQGFLASGVLRGHYEQVDEDAYQMIYRHAWM